jgi:hypothetical protein
MSRSRSSAVSSAVIRLVGRDEERRHAGSELAKHEQTAEIGRRNRIASPASLFRIQGEQVGGLYPNH